MYLCLLLPFLKHKSMKTAVCTFLQDFNLLGGLAALIVSEGFRGIHWTLTLHISPYYPSTQPVFHEIAMAAGIIPANLLYLFTICLGAALVHFLFYLLEKHFTADAKS